MCFDAFNDHQNQEANKIIFLGLDSGGLEVCANASKHVFDQSRRYKITF